MAQIPRIIVPGYPHHVTPQGNRRQQTFFDVGGYQVYLDLMSHWSREHSVDIWGYCLMPNYVHLLAVPSDPDGLCRASDVEKITSRRRKACKPGPKPKVVN